MYLMRTEQFSVSRGTFVPADVFEPRIAKTQRTLIVAACARVQRPHYAFVQQGDGRLIGASHNVYGVDIRFVIEPVICLAD